MSDGTIYVEIYKSDNPGPGERPQPYRFRAKTANNEIILPQEGYTNSGDAEDVLALIFGGGPVILTTPDGKRRHLR